LEGTVTNHRPALRLALLLGTVLGPGSALRSEEIPPQKIPGRIDWVYRYAEGQRLAGQSGKPLFVVFRCER
jgi:hypothetical protein